MSDPRRLRTWWDGPGVGWRDLALMKAVQFGRNVSDTLTNCLERRRYYYTTAPKQIPPETSEDLRATVATYAW
ncbi:hypothetical protein CDAR_480401 [Caerostris darwini]|uniref:Uncharacterized protein n=1 Tax=Caerostris darwini TaxID=1538125 RepID=A0AAV4V142_9ARAC|nr:hypothetical protein CDAR_480401 [Caerostris darwini]